MSSSVVAPAPAPALTPDPLKKQQKKQRQKVAKAALHAALAACVEADRVALGMAEADVGTVAIAVPAEVEAGSAGGLASTAGVGTSIGITGQAEAAGGGRARRD